MPSASDHDQQAASNDAFYRELGATDAQRSDWAMTVLFYAAVHEVQALIARKRTALGIARLPKKHHERLAVLSKYWPQLEVIYRALKDWSEDARYECGTFSKAQLTLAEGQLKQLRNEIKAIP